MEPVVEHHAWGVEITRRPFPETRPEIKIQVAIKRPQGGRRAVTTVWFTGVPSGKPLRLTDMTAWRNCMTITLTDAGRITDEMTAEARAPKKRSRKRH